ncbi:hypothetical protein B0I35DRAFT_484386 [Stachybotrys elegans]|uniref:Rhodopsin domain-containing protein n=1 Tax=Stachybotrys elegans TaxID=80388 RepID=A0A8K0SEV6_9HYPO|nr:hypothetical protein B0I35DRAFT_484386 [Stachybotrys elegans]
MERLPFQSLFIASLLFPINQFCAKLSILFLYHRIFGVNGKFAFWIKAVGALQTVHTIKNLVFLAVNKAANSLIDFIMAIQAVIMLRSLRTTKQVK